jgi:nucleotide-binding universal stress UspA family protein
LTETKQRAKARLCIFCDKVLAGDPECADRAQSIEVVEGYTPEDILKKADELPCDSIIMETYGKGLISHTFLESVVERVLRRVRRPVYTIPLPKQAKDITFHNI